MHIEHPQKLEAALYVVATPIGNLRDITLRALDVLQQADVVAAEDTRNTSHLLKHHGIHANRLIAVHQHNERHSAERVAAMLKEGLSVAFVSDAGTPAVSDPGALLVREVRTAGFRVIPVPGASAFVAAISASGFTAPHFLFYGFLPSKSAARKSALHELAGHPYTLVFYEAPHRIVDCVSDLRSVLGGDRRIALAREITKLFETVHECALDDAVSWLLEDENRQRGEFVLLVSGREAGTGISTETEGVLSELLEALPLRQAVQIAANITRANRSELYQLALRMKG